MTRKEINGTCILVFFSVVTAFVYNHLSPFGIAVFGQWETEKGVVTAKSKTDSVNNSIEINTLETVRQIVQKKQRVIIDVRPKETYDTGHIPGAVSFPLTEFDEQIGQILNSINRQDALLVYCSSVACTDSHTFADRLTRLRYDNVKVFSGGFRQWQERGYDIEKNEE